MDTHMFLRFSGGAGVKKTHKEAKCMCSSKLEAK